MNDIEKKVIEAIVLNTVKKLMAEKDAPNRVPLGISNKHLHLSQEHIDILFGKGYELTAIKDMKQPGQYACKECVKIIGPKGEFSKVRILGPARPETQVELSMTDARTIGVNIPIRESGALAGTPGLVLEGPCGRVEMEQGVIAALRHIHMTPEVAEELGLQDGDCVGVESSGLRPTLFRDVLVRVSPKYAYEMHIDTDEANAAGLQNDDMLKIVKKQEK